MAHIIHGVGPYPDKAGEFCGNHLPGRGLFYSFWESRESQERDQKSHLARMRFGKPSSCKAGTSEEMAANGWVGLYLKEDRKLLSWETPFETDALTEAVVASIKST